MIELIQLEDGSGNYQLEDGSGSYRQDFPIIVEDSTVEVTESSNRKGGLIRNLSSTLGITESFNRLRDMVTVGTKESQ